MANCKLMARMLHLYSSPSLIMMGHLRKIYNEEKLLPMLHSDGLQEPNFLDNSGQLLRRSGSAVECRTLDRESPVTNPLHIIMALLMATRCGGVMP